MYVVCQRWSQSTEPGIDQLPALLIKEPNAVHVLHRIDVSRGQPWQSVDVNVNGLESGIRAPYLAEAVDTMHAALCG